MLVPVAATTDWVSALLARAATISWPGAQRSGFARLSRVGPKDEESLSRNGSAELHPATVITDFAVPGMLNVIASLSPDVK